VKIFCPAAEFVEAPVPTGSAGINPQSQGQSQECSIMTIRRIGKRDGAESRHYEFTIILQISI
jgi:hypothetical protein